MSIPGLYEDQRNQIYLPTEDRELSEAVVQTVAEYEGVDPLAADFRLYDSIDPTALNTLFQFDQGAAATLSFGVGDSYVLLRDIGVGVEIWVSDIPHG